MVSNHLCLVCDVLVNSCYSSLDSATTTVSAMYLILLIITSFIFATSDRLRTDQDLIIFFVKLLNINHLKFFTVSFDVFNNLSNENTGCLRIALSFILNVSGLIIIKIRYSLEGQEEGITQA